MRHNIYVSTFDGEKLISKVTTTALIEDNHITYSTDNDLIKINLTNFNLIKENLESIFSLTNKLCEITLKDEKKTFNIPLISFNYSYNYPNIEITYQLASQDKPLKIEIEIGAINNEI